MASTTLCAAMLACAVVISSAAPIKMGGPIQDVYKPAFMAYVNWANSEAEQTDVTASFTTFDAATAPALITKMTTAGDATYVDVLVCPYGSGDVKKCVDAVNKAYVGPVLAWGGASDGIFDTNCAALTNKNCFGFFTVGSKYAATGLVAMDGKINPAKADVAVIVNNNAFSKSVAVGINATITAQAGLNLQSYTTISVAKKALTASDTAAITAAMAKKPHLVVIAGHNLDVEPTIIQIGKGANVPQAILATNGITKTANYAGDNSKYAKCVMMPTQWDSSTTTADPVVKWTSAIFKLAMGGTASYQMAAAGAAGVAIANAVKKNADPKTLVASLTAMDVDSFYGKLKWDAKGRIQKPMYTVQLQGTAQVVVAPGTATMSFPLSGASCWGAAGGAAAGAGATTSGTSAKAVSASVFSMMLLAWISK